MGYAGCRGGGSRGNAVITYPAKSAEGQASPLWGRERNSDERNSDDVVMITQGKVLKPTATPNGMPPPSGTRLPSVHQIQGLAGPPAAPRPECGGSWLSEQCRDALALYSGDGPLLCPTGRLWEQGWGDLGSPEPSSIQNTVLISG